MNREFNKRVGLALGGGVVRGMAHIGVLSVLEEEGIPIDFIAGTSAGSAVATLYASGKSVEEIKMLGENLRWWTLLRLVFPRQGFFSFDPLRKWLTNKIGDIDFCDLRIPLGVVATDMNTGCPVEFVSGRVAPAVQASCSVPGIITPVNINGNLLCDGSVSDTIPVGLLRKMGAEFVIGVDIFPSYKRLHFGPLGNAITALEILIQRAGGGIDSADCLIAPELRGLSYVRFSLREKFYELGRTATKLKIPAIRAALQQ